jgi:hypothetical protein
MVPPAEDPLQLRQGKRADAKFLGGAGPSAVPVTNGRRSQPLPLCLVVVATRRCVDPSFEVPLPFE